MGIKIHAKYLFCFDKPESKAEFIFSSITSAAIEAILPPRTGERNVYYSGYTPKLLANESDKDSKGDYQ